jgi:hypothetical protein
LRKYLLGSLLNNNEGNLSCDAMNQLMLGNYAKESFQRIRGQKYIKILDRIELNVIDK